MAQIVIDVANGFTRYPAGRYREDGPFSGQRFREDILKPPLLEGKRILVKLDGTMGFGSSFLEEAFGGLARDQDVRAKGIELLQVISFESRDPSVADEIKRYIGDAEGC